MDETGMRILLVDDDDNYSKVVALGLEEFGFDVVVAPGGQEAIDILKSGDRAFSVIVLDYRMPRVTGIDVLRWMQRHEISIPAFILTAAGSEEVVAEAMKLDAYDYFRKEDTDIEHLAAHIRGTHERHLERLARALDDERRAKPGRGGDGREQAGKFVSSLTPTLNSAFQNIAQDLEVNDHGLFANVPEHEREELKRVFGGMQKEFGKLQAVIGGLLTLYTRALAQQTEKSAPKETRGDDITSRTGSG